MGRYVYHASCGTVVTLTMDVDRAHCHHGGPRCAAADALALELAAELEVLDAEPWPTPAPSTERPNRDDDRRGNH